MSIWETKPLKISQSAKSSSKSSASIERPLPAKEIELAYKIAEENKRQALDDQYEWMCHYRQELAYMYNLFLNHMKQASVRNILSFDEFRQYVYQNTDIYLDPKTHKRRRPLV